MAYGDLLLLMAAMLAGFALGLPIFASMAVAAGVYALAFPQKLSADVIAQSFLQGIDSNAFAAIPFFFLAGELMNEGGISRRLLRFARAAIGHLRGGLSQINILAAMVFSGVSGSAVADASAVGSMMTPAMKREGYPPAYISAVTAAAACMGPIIPPSIPMVVFGLIAGTSIGKLFVAGIVPGLLMAVMLLVTSYAISVRRGFPAGPWLGFAELGRATLGGAAALLMPVLVIGALVGGVATTTEIGALACLYAGLVGALMYRELDLQRVWAALCKAAVESAAVLIVISVTGVFTYIVANTAVAQALAATLTGLTRDPVWILALVAIVLLLLGTVLEPVTMLVVIVPLLVPLARSVGIDLTHLGLVVVLATLIGMVSPPVGFLAFITAAQSGARVQDVFVELVPFLGTLVALLAAMVVFPELVLALPRALGM